MGRLLRMWEEARGDLGLVIVVPYCVDIGNDLTIRADLLVKDFGARNGMLVVTDYAAIEPHVEQLVKSGYGFSVLGEPSGNERYDRDAFIDMLSDWGWSGLKGRKPAWMIDLAE